MIFPVSKFQMVYPFVPKPIKRASSRDTSIADIRYVAGSSCSIFSLVCKSHTQMASPVLMYATARRGELWVNRRHEIGPNAGRPDNASKDNLLPSEPAFTLYNLP